MGGQTDMLGNDPLDNSSTTASRMQDVQGEHGTTTDPEEGGVPKRLGGQTMSDPESAVDTQQPLSPAPIPPNGTVSIHTMGNESQRGTPPRSLGLSSPQPRASPGAESNNPFFKKMAAEEAERKSSLSESFGQLSVGDTSNNPWQHALRPAHTGSSQQSGHARSGSSGKAPNPAQQEELVLWDSATSKPDSNPSPNAATGQQTTLSAHSAFDDLLELEPGRSQAVDSSETSTRAEKLDDWNLIDHDPNQGPSSGIRQSPTKTGAEDVAGAPGLPPRTSDGQGNEAREQSGHAPPSTPPRTSRPESAVYHVKKIRWLDAKAASNPRTAPILVQNVNGPCPLVALVNALVLTTPERGESYLMHFLSSKEIVELESLLQAVIEELMSSRCTDPDAVLPDMTDLYKFLKSLDTGMNVNPRFVPTETQINTAKRTSLGHIHPSERDDCIPGGFEDTREMKLYSTFSIPLLHGWLPAKDGPADAAIKTHAESYDEARILDFKEMDLSQKLAGEGLTEEEQETYQGIMIVKTFLETFQTQLTPYGLEVLRKSMEPGSVAILFRNDHFSTLYKHPETQSLFTLATDAGLANHEEIVWESLTNVKGATEFYSGDFRIVGGSDGEEGQQSSGGHLSFLDQSNPGAWPSIDEASSSGWQTVRHGGRQQVDAPKLSPNHEQEDQDFAMALQLQEEEDERHRQEQARREREQRERQSNLSERFLDTQGRRPAASGDRIAGLRQSSISAPTTGARRPGMTAAPRTQTAARTQTVRPLVPPPGSRPSRPAVYRPPTDGDEEAPPSYDESANDAPFRPPVGHPTHPNSTPRTPRSAVHATGPSNVIPVTRGSRTNSMPVPGSRQNSAGPSGFGPGRPGRQPVPAAVVLEGGSAHGKKECVVM